MQCDSVKSPLSCVKLAHVELPCLSVVFSWHILAQMQGRAHEASHPPHQPTIASSFYMWTSEKAKTQIWNIFLVIVLRTKLTHLWEFWNSDLFLCAAYYCHGVRSRTVVFLFFCVGFFFQVIITCPWVAGLTCCISGSHPVNCVPMATGNLLALHSQPDSLQSRKILESVRDN